VHTRIVGDEKNVQKKKKKKHSTAAAELAFYAKIVEALLFVTMRDSASKCLKQVYAFFLFFPSYILDEILVKSF
jgi:hypothetical protein